MVAGEICSALQGQYAAKRLSSKQNHTVPFLKSGQAPPTEIIDNIALLKNSESKGYDNFATTVIKQYSLEVSSVLADILNLSLTKGVFPDQLKIAKVIPIFKVDDKLKVSNYRPISILSPFSKILENFFYVRLLSFVNQSNILTDSQYGFRKTLTTELASPA